MKKQERQNRSRGLFLCLLSLLMTLGGTSSAWGDNLTIANGGNTNQYVPLYGSYADTNGAVSEFIVPAASLASINGKDITKLTFYTSTPSDKVFTATFKVYLKEIEETVYDDAVAFGSTDATTVYTGTLDATGTTMVIDFSSNYKYNGGNLLVGIQVTSSGNWSSALIFSGETQSGYTGFSSKASTKKQKFIPKTTFTTQTEGPGFEVKNGSTTIESPFAYSFGLATAGTTKTFTLSNPGTAATPISVDVSEADGFTAAVEDNATSIPAGGQKTLTITMPDATASGSIVVTPTGDGLSAFTFNVSGTRRDPNKVYLDFADGQMPEGWTSVYTSASTSSSYAWTASTGYIRTSSTYSSYTNAFTSPKLTFAENETILFKTATYSQYTATCSIAVEYSTDGTNWTTIDTFTDDTYGNWTSRSVQVPTSDAKYIRFNGYNMYLTEIYGGQLPLNPTPKDLAYSTLTNTSAQLSWTSTASNFNIQYKADGAADWTTIQNVTANPYTLSGLTAVTTYQVRVQADHGVNGLSDYTDPISFTTKPDPISAYPYTENFNSLSSGEIPQYWDNSEGTTSNANYKWVYYATGHDGACVRFNSYYNSYNTNFLKTRPFSWASGTTMKLSFYYKNPKGGDFSVYASTDGGATYPTALATGLTNASDWTLKEITLPAAVYGNNVVIVFKGTSNNGSGDAYIYLDDVTVSEVNNYSLAISGTDVSENTIAFGTVKNTTTTKTFTITNDGLEDLTGISVVSSDATVFTVSDTGFDLASGATKDITVTFVKGVAAAYEETITISQTNIATDKILTVTGTYADPDPATIAVKLGGSAVGATVAFGTVGKAKSKTFTVENTGEVALDITSIASSNTTDFTVSPATLTVAGGETGEFTVTFAWDGEALNAEKTANITVTPSNAGLDPIEFAVTGTRVDMWSEDFTGNTLPTGWESDGDSYWSFDEGIAQGHYNSTYNMTKALTTPSLTVTGTSDELTFKYKRNNAKMYIKKSKDGADFENLYQDGSFQTDADWQTYTITGLEAGNYKFQFMNEDYKLDDFEGFKLTPAAEHEAVVKEKTIPTTGNQYVEYTASVNVKVTGTNDEHVTVKFFIGDTQYGESVVKDINSDATETFEVTFTPNAAVSGDAYFTIESENIAAFESDKVAVTIAAALVLDETVDPGVLTSGSKPSMVVKYNAKNGWNTICMPFELTTDILNSIFGTGWKAYEFKSYSEGTLGFSSTTTFYAGYPYIVYIETAAVNAEGIKLFNKEIGYSATTARSDTYGGATFQGTYAPVAAPGMEGKWGVTPAGKIAKGTASASIKGFRAYFDLPATDSAPSISFEDAATGIKTVITADELNQNGEVYNLNGQKVQNAHKGLYIVNGRKVVVNRK